jgi:hypothetical protein
MCNFCLGEATAYTPLLLKKNVITIERGWDISWGRKRNLVRATSKRSLSHKRFFLALVKAPRLLVEMTIVFY